MEALPAPATRIKSAATVAAVGQLMSSQLGQTVDIIIPIIINRTIILKIQTTATLVMINPMRRKLGPQDSYHPHLEEGSKRLCRHWTCQKFHFHQEIFPDHKDRLL